MGVGLWLCSDLAGRVVTLEPDSVISPLSMLEEVYPSSSSKVGIFRNTESLLTECVDDDVAGSEACVLAGCLAAGLARPCRLGGD